MEKKKKKKRILELVAIPFSRGSSWPRNWTQVSCVAGRFFTVWATILTKGKNRQWFNLRHSDGQSEKLRDGFPGSSHTWHSKLTSVHIDVCLVCNRKFALAGLRGIHLSSEVCMANEATASLAILAALRGWSIFLWGQVWPRELPHWNFLPGWVAFLA